MEDLISIVIITYKRPVEILRRAINSAISQDYGNIEVIVVNDCPEDIEGSKAIDELVDSYHNSKITLIHHLKNKGANAARNTGLYQAKGSYIAFLDDDDEWYFNKLSKQYNAIKKNKKYGIAYSGFLRVSGENKTPCYPVNKKSNESCLNKILVDNYVGPTSFSLIRMEAIKSVGGFDENIKICQEYELWIRILEKYDAICVNDLLGIYYYSEDSTFKDVDKYLNGCNALIEKHEKLYKKNRKLLSNKLLNMSIYALKKHRFGKALYYKSKALKSYPFNPNNLAIVMLIGKIFNR